MAPYTGDTRIQGLHVVSVLNAARALIGKLAGYGGAEKLYGNGVANPELTDLEDAVNRLVQFEREAKSRGTLKHTTDATDLVQALDAARGLLKATASQRDAMSMSEEESAAAFDADDLFGEPAAQPVAQTEPGEDESEPDPFAAL